jgi:glycosyltransferase involved in cell wall biosynthesis
MQRLARTASRQTPQANAASEAHTRVRVLHLVSHPIQYFVPLYRCLAARNQVDLTVAFYSDAGVRRVLDPGFQREIQWDVGLLEGYRHWFLDGADRNNSSGRLSLTQQRQVVTAILAQHYDVLWVHGYNSLNHLVATVAASAARVPVLLREEATLLDQRPWRTRIVKAVVLPVLARLVHAGLYIGRENRQFLERYGLHGSKLFFTPYSVDNGFFQGQANLLKAKRQLLKSDFGLNPQLPVVLFSGKLIPKKDPWTLVRAFEALTDRVECSLLIVGDGPLRKELAEHLQLSRTPNVHMAGFLNQSEISKAYIVGDILVLPSIERETWGLVVNEAMNFGLPIVVSDKVGCGADLVQDGINGAIFRAGSSVALADALFSLLAKPDRLREFGAASRRLIDDWSLDRTAEGISEAIRTVTRGRRGRLHASVKA